MKKFVGYVNGKSFDNEKDFSKAALEAINSDEDNIAISSYYSYVNDVEEKEEKHEELPPVDPYYVDESEYTLQNVEGKSKEYVVSEELEKKLQNASNKLDIIAKAKSLISTYEKAYKEREYKVNTLKYEIENLQDELQENEDLIKDLNGRISYYKTIIDVVDAEEPKTETKIPVTRDRIKNVLGVDGNTSLASFLKQLGLLW